MKNILSLEVTNPYIESQDMLIYSSLPAKLDLSANHKSYKLLAPVVHWDGKLFPFRTEAEKVDRLAVLVTRGDIEQFLAVPALPNSTGKEQAAAMYDVLLKRNLEYLDEYKNIDKEISQVVSKIVYHLWYLNPLNVSLSFFDDEISILTKRSMVEALRKIKPNEERIKRLMIKDIKQKEIENFICDRSKEFFDKLSLPTDFLETDSTDWNENSYKQCLDIVNKIKVVND
ncbi:unnamed protein product [Brassicogethes aeneus]|uniref:Uncharacterized protein n=1 Tax=Brassicogethes aeneus TaxID=1431903 RepID=A0A9P0B8I6_BRAAE|nr:unnamed protein product [Brassicogethes aeneus]